MIFVLGGEGFLGSAFMAELDRRRQPALAVTRKNYARLKGRDCTLFINANGNPVKFLAEKDPALDFDLAVRTTLGSLLDFRYDRYLYISSTAVYPDPSRPATTREDQPLSPPMASRYGFHRTVSERLVAQYARRWLVLRMGGLIGPGLKKGPLFDLLRGQKLRVHPASRFQFIDTRAAAAASLDIARAHRANGIFNVAGRGAVALSALAKAAGLTFSARADARKETWNVSLAKAARYAELPTTQAGVRRLLDETEDRRS